MENLGVNWKILLGQIINFVILLFLLKRFVYKPFLSLLEKRKVKIEEGMKKSEEANILMEKTRALSKEIRDKGQDEARKLIIQAEAKAKERAQELLAEAEKEKSMVLEQAQNRAKEILRREEESQKREMIDRAFLVAERFLKERMDQSQDKKIIEELIR